ncbi:MAG: hypothetical protein OEV44_15480, partial [Spirochaetota bacterium]|nr:hypothetical protein [Spirochaetota bacterium]
MNGISEVLNRINEIQNKINKFQPESVEQFKQNYSAIQEKYYNKLKQSSENQQDNKQTSNNVNSVEQNQNINSLKPLFNGDNAEYLKIIKEAS